MVLSTNITRKMDLKYLFIGNHGSSQLEVVSGLFFLKSGILN